MRLSCQFAVLHNSPGAHVFEMTTLIQTQANGLGWGGVSGSAASPERTSPELSSLGGKFPANREINRENFKLQ